MHPDSQKFQENVDQSNSMIVHRSGVARFEKSAGKSCAGTRRPACYSKETSAGVMKIVYFQKGLLSPFLFLYKFGAIIITRDVIGIKRDEFVNANLAYIHRHRLDLWQSQSSLT